MYWEEAIELIKNHGEEPKSTFPNPYNDSDDYVVYEYERGTVKTSYIDINEFPQKIKDCFKKYLKYYIQDIQIFSSLGASEGIGSHTDPTNVLIICLEGEISYVIGDNKLAVLKAGDTIFIKRGLDHMAISSTVPRICLSCGMRGYVPRNEVTYHFG